MAPETEVEPLTVLVVGGSVRADSTGRPVAVWAARAVSAALPSAQVDLADLADVELPPSRELDPAAARPPC